MSQSRTQRCSSLLLILSASVASFAWLTILLCTFWCFAIKTGYVPVVWKVLSWTLCGTSRYFIKLKKILFHKFGSVFATLVKYRPYAGTTEYHYNGTRWYFAAKSGYVPIVCKVRLGTYVVLSIIFPEKKDTFSLVWTVLSWNLHWYFLVLCYKVGYFAGYFLGAYIVFSGIFLEQKRYFFISWYAVSCDLQCYFIVLCSKNKIYSRSLQGTFLELTWHFQVFS